MPLRYAVSGAGAIRQGEILGPVWEHQPLIAPSERDEKSPPFDVVSIRHRRMVVVTPDCDLLWDFAARFETEQARLELNPEAGDLIGKPQWVPHVFVCDAFEESEIRDRIAGGDVWKRIVRNQDERYHHLSEAAVGDQDALTLPDLFIDFKRGIALPTRQLYEGLRIAAVERLATIPSPYIHDLIHRYFGFQSRVAVPE